MKVTGLQVIYLLFAAFGLAVALLFYVEYIQIYGFDFSHMTKNMMVNESSRVAIFELWTFMAICAVWMVKEAHELGMRNSWLYVLLYLVSPVFSFPLFLFLRDRKKNRPGQKPYE